MNKKVLILYTELAGYTLACIEAAAKRGLDITVLHWPVNAEAPFELSAIDGVDFIENRAMSVAELSAHIARIAPDVMLCSGWMDKSYVKALIKYRGKAIKVLTMDTAWNGSWKQRLMTTLAPLIRSKIFSHAWVAGIAQREYALKLGFAKDRIATGFYAADTSLYESIYATKTAQSAEPSVRSFLYVGRYIERKGIRDLWTAFLQANAKVDEAWKLTCVGAGEDFDQRVIDKDIEHLGFKQPHELKEVICKADVFILPSHFEPWGVVVHELASAGLPMIISDKVGAKEAFLIEGENGYTYEAGNIEALETAMLSMMQSSSDVLDRMSLKSHELANSHNPHVWAETLLAFCLNSSN